MKDNYCVIMGGGIGSRGNPNANIVVAPSDHLILKEDIFRHVKDVQKSLDFVKRQQCTSYVRH